MPSSVFQRRPYASGESWYRINREGINHEGYNFYAWADVARVEAWVTDGDGNYGFDEWWHLRFTFRNGRRLHIPELVDSEFYYALEKALSLFLPSIDPRWKGLVLQDYRTHFRTQSWWRKLLLPYPNKPVLFRR